MLLFYEGIDFQFNNVCEIRKTSLAFASKHFRSLPTTNNWGKDICFIRLKL